MRRQRKTTTAANLLASKRIAIAFCAAIAMVLGAMSVGATMHFYPGAPNTDNLPVASDAYTPPQHANTTVNVSPSGSSTDSKPNTPTTITDPKSLPKQDKLVPIVVSPPKKQANKQVAPLLVAPTATNQASLTLGPVSVTADTSSSVQLNASVTPSVTLQVPTGLQDILPGNTSTGNTSSGASGNTGTSTPSTGNTPASTSTPVAPSLLAPLNAVVSPASSNTNSVAATTGN